MEDAFHESSQLSKERLKALMQKSDSPAISRFLLMALLLFISMAGIVFTWKSHWWQLMVCQLFFGMVTCSVFACLHETAHNTAFKSRKINRFAAAFCGIVSLYPAAIFREFHFQHHRFTHVPGKDPEISLGNNPIPGVLSSLPVYLIWLTGLPFIVFKCFMVLGGCMGMPEFLRLRFFPFIRKETKAEVAIDSWMTVWIYFLFFLAARYISSGFYGIFIGMVVGQCILSAYLLPEHNGLPHEGNIFERTRSMNTSYFLRLLMWNMPYHAEHHAYPAIPFHALPKLHQLLGDEIRHKNDGYPDFHQKVWSRQIS